MKAMPASLAVISLAAAASYTLRRTLERRKASRRAYTEVARLIHLAVTNIGDRELNIEIAMVSHLQPVIDRYFPKDHAGAAPEERHLREYATAEARELLEKYTMRLIIQPHKDRLVAAARAAGEKRAAKAIDAYTAEWQGVRAFFEEHGIDVDELDKDLLGV